MAPFIFSGPSGRGPVVRLV